MMIGSAMQSSMLEAMKTQQNSGLQYMSPAQEAANQAEQPETQPRRVDQLAASQSKNLGNMIDITA